MTSPSMNTIRAQKQNKTAKQRLSDRLLALSVCLPTAFQVARQPYTCDKITSCENCQENVFAACCLSKEHKLKSLLVPPK